jgi:hypothetical protein
MPKPEKNEIVEILQLRQVTSSAYLLGSTPLLMNRMTKKTREHLIWPERKKNRAALEASQKHNPPEEFRDSVYRCEDPNAPTVVHFPSNAFKKAMAQAAIDIPGAAKAQIGRLVSVKTPTVHIYGVPMLHMGVVKQAGIVRAPDVRTRAIFPQWACKVDIKYIGQILRESDVVNLLGAAGMVVGIGDGRTEKGTFDFGQWELVSADDKRWHDIVSKQGRKAQAAALAKPVAFDSDTEELLSWFEAEVVRREYKKPAAAASDRAVAVAKKSRSRKSNGNAEARQ